MKTWALLIQEWNSIQKKEKLFFLYALIVCFFLTMDASITKAVVNSLFITKRGAEGLPLIWLISIPINFLLVQSYNFLLPLLGAKRIFATITLLSCIVNIIAIENTGFVSSVIDALYIWKDIYIMLMFTQLWSLLHSTVKSEKAKYMYGIFYAIGGVGSICGSIVPGYFASYYGTTPLLYSTLPISFVMIWMFYKMVGTRETMAISKKELPNKSMKSNFKHGLQLIYNSKTLRYIVWITIGMQVTATLYDYIFNLYIAELYPVTDQRTEFCGKLFGMINAISLLLQICGSFFSIHYFGLGNIHRSLPLIFLALGSCFFISPQFMLLLLAYMTLKASDYSIFGIATGMLYIPLTIQEKYFGKSIISIFVYRAAKGVASLFVFIITACVRKEYLITNITIVILVFLIIWAFNSYYYFNNKSIHKAL